MHYGDTDHAVKPPDVERIRADFPILARKAHGRPLVWLDNASTSQKPRSVLEAMREVYEEYNANIHRATHELGEEATAAYEGARIKVARFIGASDETEVVFTKNVSEAISEVDLAIFVDAGAQGGPGTMTCESVSPSESNLRFSHDVTPTTLLHMAKTLYGKTPTAYLICVAGKSFEQGDALSPETAAALPEVVAKLRDFVRSTR